MRCDKFAATMCASFNLRSEDYHGFKLAVASLIICACAVAGASNDGGDAPSGSSSWSNKKFNARVSPIALLIGAGLVDFDIRVSDHWTVGPEALYWHNTLSSTGDFTSIAFNAWEAGVRANWFLDGVFKDGIYVGPSLKYLNFQLTATDTANGLPASGSANALLAGCLVGYGWFWDSFNMMLGGGLETTLGDAQIKATDSSGNSTNESLPISAFTLEFSSASPSDGRSPFSVDPHGPKYLCKLACGPPENGRISDERSHAASFAAKICGKHAIDRRNACTEIS